MNNQGPHEIKVAENTTYVYQFSANEDVEWELLEVENFVKSGNYINDYSNTKLSLTFKTRDENAKLTTIDGFKSIKVFSYKNGNWTLVDDQFVFDDSTDYRGKTINYDFNSNLIRNWDGGTGASPLRFDINYKGNFDFTDSYYFVNGKFTDRPADKNLLGTVDAYINPVIHYFDNGIWEKDELKFSLDKNGLLTFNAPINYEDAGSLNGFKTLK